MTTAVLLLSLYFMVSAPVGGENTLELLFSEDLEDSDGGFIHGGTFDQWEVGKPGAGSSGNPGPGSSGEGNRCYGSPLNSTYQEGTFSFLRIPDQDVGSYHNLVLSYKIWFDLDLLEDEENGTGDGAGTDQLLVQLGNDNDTWTTVMKHSGSSNGSWIDMKIDLSIVISEELRLRFLLVDDPDGRTDNGVFIDLVEIYGELRPMVEIKFISPPEMASYLPTDQVVKVHLLVSNEGRTIPPRTDISIEILGPKDWGPYSDSMDLSNERIQDLYIDWVPGAEGMYELFINLTVDDIQTENYRLTANAMNPIFYDDFSVGSDSWNSFTDIGDSGWFTIVDDGPTISGGEDIHFGRSDGEGQLLGFSGDSFSGIVSPPIDLVNMNEAYLYIVHSFGFLGEQGTSGGIVQGMDLDGNWITLEPDLPHLRLLDPDSSGPLGGEYGFQGDRDWYQIGFDLGPVVGAISTIRFAVSSGADGEGRGWMIDDVMIVGEGFDPYDTEPPEPIMGITVKVVEDGWVEIEWTPSFATDLHHYNVYLGEGQPVPVTVSDLFTTVMKGNDTIISLDDLEKEGTYWVAVTAVDRNGNEGDYTLQEVFYPSSEGGNLPPVAKGRVVGTTKGRLGDEFRFNASSSYDPDNDPIDFEWTFPDGSTQTGVETTWKSTISGEGLIVELRVSDDSGASGVINLTISIDEKNTGNVETEDIYNFLLCMAPLSILIIFVVLVVTFLRGSRQRRLRRRLLWMGQDGKEDRGSEDTWSSTVRSRSTKNEVRPKIADLVPIVTVKSAHRPETENKVTVKEKTVLASPIPEPSEKKDPKEKEPVPRKVPAPVMVTALVECPFCRKTFKTELERSSLDSGGSLNIHCPHCGRSGQT